MLDLLFDFVFVDLDVLRRQPRNCAAASISHGDGQVDEFSPLADDNRRFVNGRLCIAAERRVLREGRVTASEQHSTDSEGAVAKDYFVHDGLFFPARPLGSGSLM